MSVILHRALPDVRDGLKPVHRRILFSMHSLRLSSSAPFRKSARVVGDVLGKLHPHGDAAVYDALVRLAQPFAMALPLVQGHGNFGSTDGDPPAAMRYTECRLAPVTEHALLQELHQETGDFAPNFDGSEMEPRVLPAKIPSLLVNGSAGIAVGLATNVPPHNLQEVVDALSALIRHPRISDDALLQYIPAPDFPTGGQILGTDGARGAYLTGRGRVVVRACTHREKMCNGGPGKKQTREAIVITELPYQVNKAALVRKIAKLADGRKLTGISGLRDESDRNGTRIVIEVKTRANASQVLADLFKKTQLQTSFAANLTALDGGRFPVQLTLRQCLEKFLDFRREVVRRRVAHDLKNAEERLHIVEGLLIIQENVGLVVACIRESADGNMARESLMERISLTGNQAEAVLKMQLRRLTSLEHSRLNGESEKLQSDIKDYKHTLSEALAIDNIIVAELTDLASLYSTPRRSSILHEPNAT